MNLFNKQIPTRTEKTENAYVKTYEWLRRRFMKENQQTTITPDELVAHLLTLRPTLSMKSFNAYKSAVLYYLKTHESNFEKAIEILTESNSIGLNKRSTQTSGRKLKQVPDEILKSLREKNNDRIKLKYRHSEGLRCFMEATLLTGLRPNEWAGSTIRKHQGTGRPVLHVQNSKNTNGRANGDERELFIDELQSDELIHIENTIKYFSAASSTESALLALKHEMETTRMLALGNSLKWRVSVTLYSFRHQFMADAKTTFKDPVIISAIAGHFSTKTAFEHYGAMRHGRRTVKVLPTPESVAAVQKRTLEIYSDFVNHRLAENTSTPNL